MVPMKKCKKKRCQRNIEMNYIKSETRQKQNTQNMNPNPIKHKKNQQQQKKNTCQQKPKCEM